jgi:energy-coupling factor transporter transmembrane protein EcfT
MVTPHYDNLSTPFTIVNKGTALTFTFTWHGEKKTTRYQPQLGFFFLIAIMALPFIALRPKWYMALAAFHILAMLLVAAILYFSRFGWYPGFIIIDFLVSYLIPGLTFIYVVVVLNLETDYSLLQKVNTYSLPKTR